MKKHENIENLRKKISIADENSVIGDEFAKLLNHPMLTWNDLIGFLRFKLIVGECASFKLHDYLDVPIPSEGPIQEKSKWYDILENKQIEPSDCVCLPGARDN